jgi:hypothetical protein
MSTDPQHQIARILEGDVAAVGDLGTDWVEGACMASIIWLE